jgi:hypothetical protein
VNPVTNTIYVANGSTLSSNVTAITEQNVQVNGITVAIQALPANTSTTPTPTFTFTPNNAYHTGVLNVYYQVDTWQEEWSVAAPSGGGVTWTGTTAPLQLGIHILYAFATDGSDATSNNAPNAASSPVTGSIRAYVFLVTPPDTTPPTIIITTPANGAQYLLGQAVNADYACQDEAGGSGLASCVGTVAKGSHINTASVGAKTFTVNAADKAGNTSSKAVNYSVIYNFTGFFSPVANPPTLNSLKAGKSVSVIFSLAGNKGLNIFPANKPTSQRIDCTTLSPMGSPTATNPPGSSGLSYSPKTNQYTYSWQTDSTWAETCRQFILTLNDGTQHVADFKLTK